MEAFFQSKQPKGNLVGKTVLVTGASSGIGADVGRHLALVGGANVVLAARRIDRLLELEADISAKGGSAFAVSLDVTKEEDFARAFVAAELKFGRVDAVFANAGWGGSFWNGPDMPSSADAERVMDINYFGVRRALSAALKTFRKHGGGVFVATSSVLSAARRGTSRLAVDYNATKAAVDALVRACGDLAPEGIRVYGVLPAVFHSEMTEKTTELFSYPSTDALASMNPVFPGVACPGELLGPLLRRLIVGEGLPIPPGTGLAIDGPGVFLAQQLYSAVEADEVRKVDLQGLYNIDLDPMPLTEAERDAMLEALKKAKQAL